MHSLFNEKGKKLENSYSRYLKTTGNVWKYDLLLGCPESYSRFERFTLNYHNLLKSYQI